MGVNSNKANQKPPGGRAAVGHPVDAASGVLFLDCDDFVLDGRMPLAWYRRYSTALLEDEPSVLHGPGWWSSFEVALRRDLDGYRMRSADGEGDVEFEEPEGEGEQGAVARNLGLFHELRRSADKRFVVTAWDPEEGLVTRYFFEEEPAPGWWPLRSVEVVGVGALDLTYDAAGRLSFVTQRREGRRLRLAYGDSGRLAALFLMAGPYDANPRQVARFDYDAQGRLVRHTDAGGFTNAYAYDDDGRMTQHVNACGTPYRFKYDGRGRCIETTGPDGYDYKALTYSEGGDRTLVTDSLGNVRQFEFDPDGLLLAEISPMGLTSSYTYDEHGRVVERTTVEDGEVTHRFEYDASGNRCIVVIGTGGPFALTFDKNHQPLALADPAGGEWVRQYDQQGRTVATTNPLGETWRSIYDDRGDLVEIVNPAGHRCRMQYNEQGDLIMVTDWEGRPSRYEYNPYGYLTRWIDPLGRETRAAWDLNGNLLELREPDGTSLRYEYGPEDELIRIVDEQGNTSTLTFSRCGLLEEVIFPDGARHRYRWSTEPRWLDAIINDRGDVHRFERNGDGQVVYEQTFDGRTFQIDYEGSFIKSITNQRGETTTFAYDDNGALTRQTHADGSWVSFAYDPHLGVMTQAANADSMLAFAYDLAGRPVEETLTTADARFSVWSTYDAMGNRRARRTSSGHVAHYDYTPNGWLSRLQVDEGSAVHFEYNEVGEEVARILPGGGRILHEYNRRGQVTRQQVTTPGASPGLSGVSVDRRYSYDVHNNLITIQDGRWGTTHFAYDPAERLRAVRRSVGTSEVFSYDGTGNITGQRQFTDGFDAGLSIPAWRYQATGRLEKAQGIRYEYDDLGRTVARIETTPDGRARVHRYRWSADGRLAGLTTPEGEHWRYAYDALGRRIAKHLMPVAAPAAPGVSSNGSPDAVPLRSVYFFWDGDQIIEEQHTTGRRRIWLFEPQTFVPLSLHENGEALFCIADPAGAPRELVRADGQRVWSIQHRAWGQIDQVEALPGVDCPIRFEGQWFDAESGLHYNGHRYYDPAIGRYLSPDPAGMHGSENPYAYAINPTGWTDPWGLMPRCPRRRRTGTRTVRRGSDAPAGGGVYVFTDRNGNRYVGSTNNFRARMNNHLNSGHLPPGTRVQFFRVDPGTRVNGTPRSARGQRRIRRFVEQQTLGTSRNGDVRRNPSSGWAAVQQWKWDTYGPPSGGQWYNNPYFN